MLNFIFILIILFLAWNYNLILGIIATVGIFAYIIYSSIPQFYARKGNVLYNEGKTKEAIKCYEKAYKTGRASEGIIFTYAVMMLRNGIVDKAESIFNSMIVNRAMSKDSKYKAKQYRALIYFKRGDVEEAFEEANEIFDDFKNTMGYALLGYLKVATNTEPEKNLEFCKEAYDYNSDDRDIVDNLVVAYINVGDYENAREIADDLLEENPNFVEARFHSALVYKNLKEEDKAIEILKGIDEECKRTYMTTVSEEEVEDLKNSLKII